MTHTKEKPTAEEIMEDIQKFGEYCYRCGQSNIRNGQYHGQLAENLKVKIRTAITELINNQK